MRGLRKYLTPFAPDQSGAVSVLFELGGIVASFVIRYCLKLVQKGRFRGFAIYCFVIGFVTLIMNYVVTIHR